MIDFLLKTKYKNKAFNLIELLISIAIISLLASILVKTYIKTYKNSKSKINKTARYYNQKLDIMLYSGDDDSTDIKFRVFKNQNIYLGYNEDFPAFDTNNLVNLR